MPKVFALSESAYQRGSDYDIVMLYQMLLGRNPENSQVIQDHRANPLNQALHTFLGSPEFRESVLDPITNGGAVRRHDIVPRPSSEQLNWLFSRTVLDETQKTALRQAANWEQFFQYLCSLDGFLEQLPPPPPRPARPPVQLKPVTRAPAPIVVQQPAPVPAAAPPPAHQGSAELMARLDRLEAMLDELTRMVGALHQPTGSEATVEMPDAADFADARLGERRDAVEMDAGEVLVAAPAKVKPSRNRQAR